MKILVKNRKWVEEKLKENPQWFSKSNVISIYSRGDCSPFPDSINVLKLQFDDVAEYEQSLENSNDYIFFDESLAKKVYEFFKNLEDERMLFVHCDAGFSRSGAIGYIANEYFNKYINQNEGDNPYFKILNFRIIPNPLVVRIMKDTIWGSAFANITINDYEYDEDGNIINHFEKI